MTIHDVAQATGFSVATVSRVFTGNRPVQPPIAQEVRDAGRRLDYRPNRIARALRSGRSGTLGIVVPQIENPFFPRLVHEIERSASESGIAVFVADCDDDPVLEASRIDTLLDCGVDGLLVAPCSLTESRPAVLRASRRSAVVLLDRYVSNAEVDYVGLDNAEGIRAIVEHVTDAGRRRIAFVGALTTISSTNERLRAFQEAVRAAADVSTKTYLGSLTLEWGREAASQMIEDGPVPNAVVCANDLLAVGVLQSLRRRGIRVPEDVIVTGFDDTDLALVAEPALTTCRQPLDVIAASALSLMNARLERRGSGAAVWQQYAPSLVVRGSTGGGHG